MTDIVDRLFDSDEANTLTNQAAREITRLRELVKAAYVEGASDWASSDVQMCLNVCIDERFLETDAYRQLQGADTPQAEKGEA